MAFDARRVIVAAVEAALNDVVSAAPKPQKRGRMPAGRAFLLGAGVVTAARLASGPRGRELVETLQDQLGSVQDRLADYVEDDGSGES